MSGTLFVVGTPIGNLNDLSPRALETLQVVDFIAAEDTRVTLKLLNRFEIKKPLVSYFAHNQIEKGEQILNRLLAGESCALVTDAGMPAISDPGEDLVRRCHETGVPVAAVPGPSALITALAISGMPSARFCFEGFLSAEKKERRARLETLAGEERTLIFYEAPHKLAATLGDMLLALGDREIVLARELTKIHEEVFRTTLSGAIARYESETPRGEFVLIVRGSSEQAQDKSAYTLVQAVAAARQLLAEGAPPTKAAKAAAEMTGYKKNEIYAALIDGKQGNG